MLPLRPRERPGGHRQQHGETVRQRQMDRQPRARDLPGHGSRQRQDLRRHRSRGNKTLNQSNKYVVTGQAIVYSK